MLQSSRRSGTAGTIGTLPHLLDPETGLIQSMNWYPVRYNDPQFSHCLMTLADLGRITGRAANRHTGGTAPDRDGALAKAIGESVERYCADQYDTDEILVATGRELGARAVDPRRFVMFRPDQFAQADFPFVPVDDASAIGWTRGFSVSRGESVLVPATVAHIGYQPRTAGDRFERPPVSGYACGRTLEEAILSGIYEVVERDAFMIFWYNWLSLPAFDLRSSSSPVLRRTLDRYHSAPVRLFAADMTTDCGIPAVLAVMTSEQPGWPAAVVATAAGLDLEQTVAHALLELAANHLTVRWYLESGSRPVPASPAAVDDAVDHALLYSAPAMLPYLAPALQPRRLVRMQDVDAREPADVKESIDACLGRLAHLGLEVIAVDLTTADVEALGFKVVKVLIPGMQPMDFGLAWPHLGGRRLYEVPQRLGYRSRPADPSEINLVPHPFP